MACVKAGRMQDFRHRFRSLDMLVVDDIHFLSKREQSQEEFFHTFNSLYRRQADCALFGRVAERHSRS